MLDIIDKDTNIKNEVFSGITVALALVPEAVAFSFVAGVSPLIGLYAAFMMGVITALFGGRPGMISGATGAIAVVFAPLVLKHGVDYLFVAVIVMGIIQLIAGLLKMGKFARIIPHPVMLGFVNGLAIVIFLAQLGQFKINGEWMTGSNLYVMLFLVSITMLTIYFLPKLTKAVPSTLVAIIGVTFISIFLSKMGFDIQNVRDFAKGGIAGGLPSFSLPNVTFSFETLKIVFPFALTAALVGLIESLLTLALVDDLTDTRGNSNKECLGQGLANLVNGFFGGMGGCAMIGQSMINVNSGGRKRLSGLVASISLLLFILFLSPLIELIPLGALVGVMFMVVIGTFEWESLKLRKKIPTKDLFIILAVSVITVWHDLATAVITGVILSSLIFAWEKGSRIYSKIEINNDGSKIYKLEGTLFFASIASFKELFDVKNDPKNVILDFANSNILDHSSIEAINSITYKYKQNGKSLKLTNLSDDCQKLLKSAEKIIDISILNSNKKVTGALS